jgi:hypothetical protein
LSKKPASAFKRCKGKDECPLGLDHPHCAEFSLGCSMCKAINNF